MKRPQLAAILLILAACAGSPKYLDRNMDFGSVKTVAVMPFANLSKDNLAADRVREVFSNMLLATGAVYVLPPGEVARGIAKAGITIPATPNTEEIIRLGSQLKVEAVITGQVLEYGEIRSGSATANVVTLSVHMLETTTGKEVWTATSTKGSVSFWNRLFGTGGPPVNEVTEQAVDEVLSVLFK
jgi:hypothetical protein